MKIKTRDLVIKDGDINNIRKDVLNFLSSSAYKQVFSIKQIGLNLYQIVYEPVSESQRIKGHGDIQNTQGLN